jgi:hypothetical protein
LLMQPSVTSTKSFDIRVRLYVHMYAQ